MAESRVNGSVTTRVGVTWRSFLVETQCYNGQIGVDEASPMMVATGLTNCAADTAALLPLIDQVPATLGAVITRDAQLAARIKRLRNGGQTSRYHHQEAGANSRLDELQAAILRARLPHLAGWTARRRAIAARYRTIAAPAAVVVPREFDAGHVYHLFPLLTTRRDAFQAHCASHGVETLIHYPVPIPRQPALAAASPAVCAIADRICAEVVSLPMYPGLSDAQVAAVVAASSSFPAA